MLLRLIAILSMCAATATAQLAAPDPRPSDILLSRNDIIKGIVAYRNHWVLTVGSNLDSCSQEQRDALAAPATDGWFPSKSIVVPPPGLAARDARRYQRKVRNVSYYGTDPAWAWQHLREKRDGEPYPVDSASFVACAQAIRPARNAFALNLIEAQRPYPLKLDSTDLHLYQKLRLRHGERIAEIGGAGRLAELLVYLGMDVTANEPGLSELGDARAQLPAALQDRFEVRKAKRRKLALDPVSYDLILVVTAFHHFKGTDELARQMREALRPGGRLVVIDAYTDRRGASSDLPVKCASRQAFEEHLAVLREAGFELVREETVREFDVLTEWMPRVSSPSPSE